MRHFIRWLCAVVLVLLPSVVFAQTSVIRGRVADSSGAPVIRAAVSSGGAPAAHDDH